MIIDTKTQPLLKRLSSCLSTQSTKSRGSDLLEEWPTTKPSDAKDAITRKQVTFAKFSGLRTYIVDPKYQTRKSYSKADKRAFEDDAAREGIRIQQLISSVPLKSGYAVKKLIEHEFLTREELLGIEHLINEKDAFKIVYERRAHSALVLKAQEELRDDALLAKVAMTRSSKSVKKAILRAALAA